MPSEAEWKTACMNRSTHEMMRGERGDCNVAMSITPGMRFIAIPEGSTIVQFHWPAKD